MVIYKNILDAVAKRKKLLAVLIDPDKFTLNKTKSFIIKVNQSIATHIFVGGSIVDSDATGILISEIKKYTNLPIILFPGDVTQISEKADALLFLSLISGRNPEYLIGKQVKAVSKLKNTSLEVIPTGYVLIEGGKVTSTQKVTDTKPLLRKNIKNIVDTTKAGEFLGMKLMYLEAGSGASQPLNNEIIRSVKNALHIPVIVGGGIKNKAQLSAAYGAGADLVVIGTAFEEDETFFSQILNSSPKK